MSMKSFTLEEVQEAIGCNEVLCTSCGAVAEVLRRRARRLRSAAREPQLHQEAVTMKEFPLKDMLKHGSRALNHLTSP